MSKKSTIFERKRKALLQSVPLVSQIPHGSNVFDHKTIGGKDILAERIRTVEHIIPLKDVEFTNVEFTVDNAKFDGAVMKRIVDDIEVEINATMIAGLNDLVARGTRPVYTSFGRSRVRPNWITAAWQEAEATPATPENKEPDTVDAVEFIWEMEAKGEWPR